jgi:hypothetical protein
MIIAGFRRDYTRDTCNGEEIVQTTKPFLGCSENYSGKLSRTSHVRVVPGVPRKIEQT